VGSTPTHRTEGTTMKKLALLALCLLACESDKPDYSEIESCAAFAQYYARRRGDSGIEDARFKQAYEACTAEKVLDFQLMMSQMATELRADKLNSELRANATPKADAKGVMERLAE
jgi:hypothetical protein